MTKDKQKTQNLDLELIIALTREISHRIQSISLIFPEEKEPLLRNIAACGIHLAMFSLDLYKDVNGEELTDRSSEKEFLEKCGCKGK